MELDTTKLQESMLKLVADLLSGREIKKARYHVTVEIPEQLADVVIDVGKQLGQDTDEVFSKMATEGLMESLKSLVKGAAPTVPKFDSLPDAAQQLKEKLGIDVTPIFNQLDKLKGFGEQLQGLEKVITNAGFTAKAEAQPSSEPSDKQRDSSKTKENPK